MAATPSLILRIGAGKAAGLVIGLIGYFVMPLLAPDTDLLLRWGILLWYTTMGAMIGVFGIFDHHPVLQFPMPWWLRAPLLGAWMNFVIVFFTYDLMAAFMNGLLGGPDIWTSPFWLVAEGAVIGFVIGFVATKVGGEGPAALEADLKRTGR